MNRIPAASVPKNDVPCVIVWVPRMRAFVCNVHAVVIRARDAHRDVCRVNPAFDRSAK